MIETCQFCEKVNGRTGRNQQREPLTYDGKIKYGVRHYAHFQCFLEHKGRDGFMALTAWQRDRFPWRLLREYGLLEIRRTTGTLSESL